METPADGQIEQQARRSEEERQDQGGYDEEVWNAPPLCVADLPPADEQVEGQVVGPAGEESPGIPEQRGDRRE